MVDQWMVTTTGSAAAGGYPNYNKMDRGNAFSCMKYTLIFINVFGFILSIFNALFGIGYPHNYWPGGYTGGQMAICSLFVMAFTTVGYCGAHHHKSYLLIVYGFIILLLCGGNGVVYFIYNDKSIIGSISNVNLAILALFTLFVLFLTFTLTFKLRTTRSNIPVLGMGVGVGGGGPHVVRCSTPTALLQRADSAQQQQQQLLLHQQQQHHQQQQQQQQQNSATNYTTTTTTTSSATHPCPVPGCNYGKVITSTS
ncbi:uncharacterized protein LOC128952888 [Oppia nitens]|uniref:uncharacterized protein LOC128952888 n=1 Tax=Oppia nitens TaxID=1686743 RepID=UPI0023DC2EEF|nr:uncharacterized protein LOC128952888 [Oppia nitens]